MGSIFEVTFISIFILFTIFNLTAANDDMKDNGLDRGAYSDRGGLWFGPRLGKRSLQLTDEDKSETFLRLLEAAEVLKSYNEEMPYQMQFNAPRKDDMRVIFTPKFTRAANRSGARKHYDFTPRLGRKLQEKLSAPPPQEENAIPDSMIINPVVTNPGNNYTPRLGRNYDFTPRLGREVYDLYPEAQETQIRVVRSINGTN